MAAVSELAVLSDLQFGGVGRGDAVTGLHAVPLFQLRQGAHEAGVGGIQGGDALLLGAKRALAGTKGGATPGQGLPGTVCAHQGCWEETWGGLGVHGVRGTGKALRLWGRRRAREEAVGTGGLNAMAKTSSSLPSWVSHITASPQTAA